jgi:hypothetical protein
MNVLLFILGDSPASEFYVPTFRNTVCSIFIGRLNKKIPVKIEQTECSETSEQKIQTPGNHPKEIIEQVSYSPTELQVFYFGTNDLLILANNHLDALFHVFISSLYMFRASSAHHQEI